ncbi:MAG: hypothetical protein H6Q64_2284, partial [Firmicutes bacterium]|nr:hypothetical protein [Bacillota bacterium]
TSTAGILQHSFRECDIVARVGGDEFAIAMPSSSIEVMRNACERLRTELRKHNQEKPLAPLSFSIGAAWGNCSDINIVEISKNADIEMYKDKAEHKEKYLLLFNSLYELHGEKLYKE